MQAQDYMHVFEGAEIIPITGEPISNGELVIQNGTITAVGAAGMYSYPVMPNGLIYSAKSLCPAWWIRTLTLARETGKDTEEVWFIPAP